MSAPDNTGRWAAITERGAEVSVWVHPEFDRYVADDGHATATGRTPREAVDGVTARWSRRVLRVVPP